MSSDKYGLLPIQRTELEKKQQKDKEAEEMKVQPLETENTMTIINEMEHELNEKYKKAQDIADSLHGEIQDLQQHKTQCEAQIDNQMHRISELMDENSALRAFNNEMLDLMNSRDMEIKDLNLKNDTKDEEFRKLKRESESKRKEHEEVSDARFKQSTELTLLRAKVLGLEGDLDKNERSYKAQIDELKNEGRLAKERIEYLEKIEKSYDNLLNSAVSTEKGSMTTVSECRNHEKQIKSLQIYQDVLVKDHEEAIKDVKLVLKDKNDEFFNLMRKYKDAEDTIKDLQIQLACKTEEVLKVQEIYKQFSNTTAENYEDSFEAVLRAEFDFMKSAYEQKMTLLNKTLKESKEDMFRKLRDKEEEVTDLKGTRDSLSRRLNLYLKDKSI